MQDFQFKDKYDAYDLVKIMQLLRARRMPVGCESRPTKASRKIS